MSTYLATLRRRLLDPNTRVGVVQGAKMVLAAVIAWEVAIRVLGSEQAFLAPWSAMLTVQATVLRTFKRSVQQVLATVLGVLLAYVVGAVLGLNTVSLAVLLLVCTLAGLSRALRAESTTAATSALVVLTLGYSGDEIVLAARLADTAVGIVAGIVVSVVVWPPLRDRSVTRRVHDIEHRMAGLLEDIAASLREGTAVSEDELNSWLDASRSLDARIDESWVLVRQAWESGRMNPRLRAAASVRTCRDYADVLDRLEQADAELRSMVRTIASSAGSSEQWSAEFREPWLDLLEEAASALRAADGPAAQSVVTAVATLGHDLSTDVLRRDLWPVYGALMVNLRNIVVAISDVAAARTALPERGDTFRANPARG